MGALAHYFEDEGLPTAGISLVRLHTEITRPPRALWVPFELGRPLGIPGDPAFQMRVLRAVLALFERDAGPILDDYPEDTPSSGDDPDEGMACTVSFPAPVADKETTEQALLREIGRLDQWYKLGLEQHGRTTVGASNLDMKTIASYIAGLVEGVQPENPRDDLEPGETLKLACEDLRAFYSEAVTMQPGQSGLSSTALSEWFWNETAAGKAFWDLRDVCLASDDKMMNAMGRYILVPRSQLKDVGDNPEFEAT